MTYLFVIWTLVTGALALGLVSWAILSVIYFFRRGRRSILAFAGLFLVVGGLATVLNPFGNVYLFADIADARTGRMRDQTAARNMVGQSSDMLVAAFGQPFNIIQRAHDSETWYYNPNPWFILG